MRLGETGVARRTIFHTLARVKGEPAGRLESLRELECRGLPANGRLPKSPRCKRVDRRLGLASQIAREPTSNGVGTREFKREAIEQREHGAVERSLLRLLLEASGQALQNAIRLQRRRVADGLTRENQIGAVEPR